MWQELGGKIMDILKIENRARRLMRMSPSGLRKLKGKRISPLFYHILEDANYHNENTILTKLGVYGKVEINRYPNGNVYSPKDYGKYSDIYKEYRKQGGKTYDL